MAKSVLVGVLRSKSDLSILLQEKWYRIPLAYLPKRPFTHIAFYQPASPKTRLAAKRAVSRGGPECFGAADKRIEYFGRVTKRAVLRRVDLLPGEALHERAVEPYLQCSFKKIEKLARPIRNVIPRRVSFGYTDLKTLRSARDMLELYHVAPTEQLVERELVRLKIPFKTQVTVIPARFARATARRAKAGVQSLHKRYRIDLAIFCCDGSIAIECDNRKAHAGKAQRQRDREKDAALQKNGWRVIRLNESDILDDLPSCISRVLKTARSLGGVCTS